ncbi:band 4.1-like protein 1 isoform X9 [Mercenaria mercenaria]|uniref:band 4.1-like protein 1 isoform X9 n=1 Tax=Mercenaria mercenaria TaxID=6596 RepID=UPI00234EFEE9|nr:band 4.1-like protein 1 isoform X9 [Mercenaria mercenaria]
MLYTRANVDLDWICFEIGAAPRADEEDVSYIDWDEDITDDVSTAEHSAISQRSSVITADSGRASSRSTLKSTDKDGKTKKSKKMVVCRVALLDGTTFEPKGIDKNSTGQLVFDKVTKHLDVIETDYFGLTFRDKTGKKFWLDNTKKISKQVKGGTWVFEFQVKFYPPDPMALKEDVTRYQLSLQVRVDLFNGRLPCSFATYALLGSYTVQAELGDWDQKEFGDSVQYLHDFDFAPGQNAELLEKIAELHKNHRGQTPTVAEAYFLENAKKLAMYGVDMHDVKDSENTRLSLGICATGIMVYKGRLRISRFVWPKILKLSYKRDSFYIKIRPGEFEPHERTISFRCDTHKLAKRLWKTCVEHHAFFRLKTADPPSSDTLFPRFNTRFRYSGRTAVQAKKAAEMTDREEPHIARTAERRSLHDKHKHLDDSAMKKMPYDENDLHGNKHGDPDATLERDRNAEDLYSKVQKRPNGEDASDRLDHHPGDEPGTEGPPGYSADTSALSDGGKKSKKDKEEEKKRKKEEERRRKEEEKERKRLEKLEKDKKKGKAQETSIDDVQPDPAVLEQKPKPVPTWALPGMQEMMEKRAAANQLKEDYMQLLRDTPDITSRSRLEDVEHLIKDDPRYKAVDKDARKQWFKEYVDDMLKSDFMRLLRETPSIHSQSTWPESRQEIDRDPRFQAVGDEDLREQWFNEYVQGLLKSEFMQLLKETPTVHSQCRWNDVKPDLEHDQRYQAVPTDSQREDWFDEYIQNLKKEEFKELLSETPDITSYSKYDDVKHKLAHEPRFVNIDTDAQREQYFNEYVADLLKEDFMQLLRETPDITSTSRLEDVEHKISHDPRYKAVDKSARRKWFKEYVDDLLKSDFMRLLRETPTIHSQSTWPEARQEIDNDRRFQAVASEARRKAWFNEYVQGLIKSEFMQLLKESPSVHSYARWDDVKADLEYDYRYQAVPTDSQRQDYFDEYIQNLKKEEFRELLRETPDITSYTRYDDVKAELSHDQRFQNVDTEAQREKYFNNYIQDLKRANYVQLLQDTPAITSYSEWHQSKHHIDRDPRYHAVDTELQRAKWFNEYVNVQAGRGYGDMDYGLRIGGYKSIDRKLEFIPVEPSTTATKSKPREEPMPFFEPVGETDVDSLGRKKVPPPVAKKPRGSGAYDTEDSLINSHTGVPVTVKTESYKYSPDMNDVPRSTSNIPIVETKTHKVTYEKDGIPYETEESILVSAHSVTTKSQTIDTTTVRVVEWLAYNSLSLLT